jgi:alpha-ketoglutarate-dependent taurine dioxygenase
MNAPSLGFAVAPLTPAIDAVVTGLDLARPLSEAVIARLTATVAERHVLFFEGQTLDPAAHRRFAARFGKLHVHPVYPHVDDLPDITSIETRPGDLPDNDNWHTDVRRRRLLGQSAQHSLRDARLPARDSRDASRRHPRRQAGLAPLPLRPSSLRPRAAQLKVKSNDLSQNIFGRGA